MTNAKTHPDGGPSAAPAQERPVQSSHTPGPWHVDKDQYTVIIPDKEGKFMPGELMVVGHGGSSFNEACSNARLIAAAPALLAALKVALPVLIEAREQWGSGEDCYTSAESIVLAAIASATEEGAR